jgi:hypothetical protein
VGLHYLAKGPEGDPVAVGQAPALPPPHQLLASIDPLPELEEQPGLAHARLPDDGDELRPTALDHSPVDVPEKGQVPPSPHEPRGELVIDVHPEPAPSADRSPDRNRVALALHADGDQLLVVDEMPGAPVADLFHDDRAGGSSLLEAGREIHHVARDEALALLRPRPKGYEDLPRGDPGPDGEIQPGTRGVRLGDGFEDGQATSHRPLGVVLVRHGCPEHGHDGIADELLHSAAVAFDLTTQSGMVGPEHGSHILRVGAVGAGRESHEVAEQNRDDLALFPCGRSLAHRCRAVPAEAEPLRILLAAVRASRHVSSLGLPDCGF